MLDCMSEALSKPLSYPYLEGVPAIIAHKHSSRCRKSNIWAPPQLPEKATGQKGAIPLGGGPAMPQIGFVASCRLYHGSLSLRNAKTFPKKPDCLQRLDGQEVITYSGTVQSTGSRLHKNSTLQYHSESHTKYRGSVGAQWIILLRPTL